MALLLNNLAIFLIGNQTGISDNWEAQKESKAKELL
jgi:hypothetical protein